MTTEHYWVRVRFAHETQWANINTKAKCKKLTKAQEIAAMLNRNYGPRLVYAVFTREGREYKPVNEAA